MKKGGDKKQLKVSSGRGGNFIAKNREIIQEIHSIFGEEIKEIKRLQDQINSEVKEIKKIVVANRIKPLIKQRKVSEFVNQDKEQLKKRLIMAYQRQAKNKKLQSELSL